MSHPSRRTFMLATGAGSAALASTAVAGAVVGAPPDTGPDDTAAAAGERIVAYVSDVASGEVTVMRGDTETVVTDVALARSLARLVG